MKFLSALREIEGTKVPVDRDEERRQERIGIAMRSRWPEISRSRLEFGRFLVTDTATNELYTIVRGEVVDVQFSPVAAYFFDEGGAVVFLERHHARTLAALEAQRAAREQAKAERMRPRARR